MAVLSVTAIGLMGSLLHRGWFGMATLSIGPVIRMVPIPANNLLRNQSALACGLDRFRIRGIGALPDVRLSQLLYRW